MQWRSVSTDSGFVPRDWRSRAFIPGFQPCPVGAVISPYSLNLWMILWTVNCNFSIFLNLFYFLQLCIVHKLSDYLPKQPFTKWRTSHHHWSWMTGPFRSAPQSCYYYLISNSPTYLWKVPAVYWVLHNFPCLFLPLAQLFWNLLQASNSECVYISKKKKTI